MRVTVTMTPSLLSPLLVIFGAEVVTAAVVVVFEIGTVLTWEMKMRVTSLALKSTLLVVVGRGAVLTGDMRMIPVSWISLFPLVVVVVMVAAVAGVRGVVIVGGAGGVGGGGGGKG